MDRWVTENIKKIQIAFQDGSAGREIEVRTEQLIPDPIALKMMSLPGQGHLIFPSRMDVEEGIFEYHAPLDMTRMPEEWSALEFMRAMDGIAVCLDEASDYLLESNQLLLIPEHLYMNPEHEYLLLALPVHLSEKSDDVLREFLLGLLYSRPVSTETSSLLFLEIINAVQKVPFGETQFHQLRATFRRQLRSINEQPAARQGKESHSSPRAACAIPQQEPAYLADPRSSRRDDSADALDLKLEEEVDSLHGGAQNRYVQKDTDKSADTDQFPGPFAENFLINQHDSDSSATSGRLCSEEKNLDVSKHEGIAEERGESMTLFSLLTHFSKENLRRYQKERRDKMAEKEPPLLWEETGQIVPVSSERMPHRPRIRLKSGGEIWIKENEMLVGRMSGCGVELKDRSCSRNHALLSKRHDGIYLMDLNSSHGTVVNQTALRPHHPIRLHAGDRLRFGKEEALFLP